METGQYSDNPNYISNNTNQNDGNSLEECQKIISVPPKKRNSLKRFNEALLAEKLAQRQETQLTQELAKAAFKKQVKKSTRKRYHCSVENCVYTSFYPKDLQRHMLKHTGEKPFHCELCSKSFSRYDKLFCHLKIHEGIKAFKCNLCDYAAIDAGSLKKHSRTHNNERPFKCQMCPYSARDSSQLIVHTRHHVGDTPYKCKHNDCNSAFKTASDLNRHARLHTGEKPYGCPYCEYRAAVKCNLNSHIKKKHNNTSTSCEGGEGERSTSVINSIVEVEVRSSSSSATNSEKNDIFQIEDAPDELPFELACKKCSTKCESIAAFKEHMKKAHSSSSSNSNNNIESSKSPNSEIIKKVEKEQLVNTKNSKKKRKYTGDFAKYFKCTFCTLSFVREDSLRLHIKQHTSNCSTFIPGSTSSTIVSIVSHHQNRSRPVYTIQAIPSSSLPEPEPIIYQDQHQHQIQEEDQYQHHQNIQNQLIDNNNYYMYSQEEAEQAEHEKRQEIEQLQQIHSHSHNNIEFQQTRPNVITHTYNNSYNNNNNNKNYDNQNTFYNL